MTEKTVRRRSVSRRTLLADQGARQSAEGANARSSLARRLCAFSAPQPYLRGLALPSPAPRSCRPRPRLPACVAACGTDRSMFESNFPPDGASSSYPILWNGFKRLAAGCSASEKAMLFSGTARRVYRLR